MKPTDIIQIAKLADSVIALAALLKEQSQGLSGTALYLETLSIKFEHLAKDVKNILDSPEDLVDLPLELL